MQVYESPIVYRHVDWSITVPLQMIEFNVTSKAAEKPVSDGMLWRLPIGTIMMLGFGLTGETGGINAQVEFLFGMSGWANILHAISLGDAGHPQSRLHLRVRGFARG